MQQSVAHKMSTSVMLSFDYNKNKTILSSYMN